MVKQIDCWSWLVQKAVEIQVPDCASWHLEGSPWGMIFAFEMHLLVITKESEPSGKECGSSDVGIIKGKAQSLGGWSAWIFKENKCEIWLGKAYQSRHCFCFFFVKHYIRSWPTSL